MGDLMELAARVEALAGPDREVDLAIWRLVDPRAAEIESAGRRPLEWLHCYTASLDAARSLVPKGYKFEIAYECDVGSARVTPPEIWENEFRFASTPALALTAAALRALASGGHHGR